MKTYECIAHSGNTGKQIVIFVRAYSSSSAKADALVQARAQFDPSGKFAEFYREFGNFHMS